MPLERIQRFYDDVQIPIPPQDYISKLQERLQELSIPPGALRRLRSSRGAPQDVSVWEKLGYQEIYAQRRNEMTAALREAWSEVGKLLNHPVMRIATDCTMLAKLRDEEICEILPQTFQLPLSSAALLLYRKYFFDHEKLGKSDWRYYLELLKPDQYTYSRIYAALTKPQDDVMHLVGLPSKKQYSDFLKNVLAVSDFKFKHYARAGTPEAEAEARRWAKVGMDAGERQKKVQANDTGDFLRLIQTEFEYVSTPVEPATPEMLQQLPAPPATS